MGDDTTPGTPKPTDGADAAAPDAAHDASPAQAEPDDTPPREAATDPAAEGTAEGDAASHASQPVRPEEPIDVEFEEAPEGDRAQAPDEHSEADARPSRQEALASLGARPIPFGLAAVLAAGAGAFGALVVSVLGGGGGSGPDVTRFEDRIAAVDARVGQLSQALADGAVGEGEGGGLAAAALADVTGQVSDVRSDLVALSERVDELARRARTARTNGAAGAGEAALDATVAEALSADVAALAARVDTALAQAEEAQRLASDAQAGPEANAAALAALSTRFDSLERASETQGSAIQELSAATATLAGEITGVPAGPGQGVGAAAAAIAFAGLQDAARTGGSFAPALAQARSRLPAMPEIDALAALAEEGAPTVGELANSFRQVSAAARRAETGQGGGMAERVGRAMTGVVTVRRADAPETDAAADIVARAQARLLDDNLAGAVAEMKRLREPARAEAEAWITLAERRLEIDTQLAAVRAALAGG